MKNMKDTNTTYVLYTKPQVKGQPYKVIAEGSYDYLEAGRALSGFSRTKTNIVTKDFFQNVLALR